MRQGKWNAAGGEDLTAVFLLQKIKKTLLRRNGFFRGPDRIRTDDPHNANVVRSQLRYKPITLFF